MRTINIRTLKKNIKNMEKIKYIKGNFIRSEEIKKAFLDLGASNTKTYNFDRDCLLYYIKDKYIRMIDMNDPLSQLLIENGEEIKLPEKVKGLPKTWEEWVEMNPEIKEEFFINTCSNIEYHPHGEKRSTIHYNNLSSKEDAEGLLALIKLKRLRDYYNDGWEPNWNNDGEIKFCIVFCSNKIELTIHINDNTFLAFRTQELRNEFYNNFEDLINKAKMWL